MADPRADTGSTMETTPLMSAGDLMSPGGAGINNTGKDAGKAKSSFGGRNIGFFGATAVIINNVTGPGMVTLPVLFAQAGWVLPTLAMVVMMVTSTFASTLMAKAMTLVDGNSRLQKRLEMTTLAKALFPHWAYLAVMVMLIICLQASNISAIIISAQTMDFTLVAIYKSCALEFYPSFGFVCVSEPGDAISAFGDAYVLTLGFLLVALASIPLGYFNLDDNIAVQIGAFFLMVAIICEWVIVFVLLGPKDGHTVPAFGESQYVVNVLGTIVFNYAYVVTIPSILNEKKKDVGINKSLWISTAASTVIFMIIGLGGALVFRFGTSGNPTILTVINDATGLPGWLHAVSQVCVYLFPLATLISGIPIMAIVIRYNLINAKLCGPVLANFFAVVVPFLFSIPFYTGDGLQSVIAWTGLFVNGLVNFVVPIVLYIIALRNHKRGRVISIEEDGASIFDLGPLGSNQDDWGIAHEFFALPRSWSAGAGKTALRLAVGLVSLNILLLVACWVIDFVYLAKGTNLVG